MLTRRECLRLAALGTVTSILPVNAICLESQSARREELIALSEELLIDWCNGMLNNQVINHNDPTQHGGLMSPGDGRILGRCADAVYPLLWCAHKQNDERYVTAAVDVMNWSLANVSFPDGSWKNGINQTWRGITVFIATAMAQALHFHGDLLDRNIRNSWLDRLRLTSRWLEKTVDEQFGNVNYSISNSYALVLLGEVLEEPGLTVRGRELAQTTLEWFTERDNLLYGEGRTGTNEVSPKGCYPVDLGYNVEGSLPAMALYGLHERDEGMLRKTVESMRVHLEFMLPDGGWDNSWGVRNFKWTWWGSRTTDGCQPAYALLADRDPVFLEAAYRNTQLLKSCTKDGLLYGGPHNIQRGIKASIHHTFCHAKALAVILDHGIPEVADPTSSLPCEESYGIRSFSDIYTWLIAHGSWRATVTGYDFPYRKLKTGHASGGALSVLWHKDAGLLLAASMSAYRLVERFDMQKEAGPGFETLTPRLEMQHRETTYEHVLNRLFDRDGGDRVYTNILDFAAEVTAQTESDVITVRTVSQLLDRDQEAPRSGKVQCSITYRFTKDTLEIDIAVQDTSDDTDLVYFLPVVCEHTVPIQKISNRAIVVKKDKIYVRVSSDNTMTLPESLSYRVYNYVPGVEAFPVKIPMSGKLKIRIETTEPL